MTKTLPILCWSLLCIVCGFLCDADPRITGPGNGRVRRFIEARDQPTPCCECNDHVPEHNCTGCNNQFHVCYYPAVCATTLYYDGNQLIKSKGCMSRTDCLTQWALSNATSGCAAQDTTMMAAGSVCTYCCVLPRESYSDPNEKNQCVDREQNIYTLPPVCETCDGANCQSSSLPVTVCQPYETFCLNAVQVDIDGNLTVVKKTCSTKLECVYDHSSLASACRTSSSGSDVKFDPGADRICQYCCQGNAGDPPCNRAPVPDNAVNFDTQCATCFGPPGICEQLYHMTACQPPNNYCINVISNRADGSRIVKRSCGNVDTCYRDWYVGTSDSDKCQNFDDRYVYTLDFDCTFCCTKDRCNVPIHPSDNTLYQDIRP
ncbi:hypothetical protein MAR_034019 [Mya arenaria]|uniref:Uncharacterized protein n=1 Tax=Mya arenaria TaxID=6604 RepID=A0ABY7GAM7_MYAAR|nr:hypothetical protein MAR_034019 [Mya arenaria]